MVRVANGRKARFYLWPAEVRDNYVAVTYWKKRNGKWRQLTPSPKLMRRVLRADARKEGAWPRSKT